MKQLIAASVFVGIVSTSGLAAAAETPRLKHRFTEYANVIDVEPVFRKIRHEEPKRECWIEQEEHVVTYEGREQSFGERRSSSSSGRSGGDAIIGGIIGGVIGNQIGGRSGRKSTRNGATVAGAIIGSAIANEVGSSDVRRHRRSDRRSERRVETHQPRRVVKSRPVERCRESMHTTYEQRVYAYDVTYEYRGRTFTTRMNRDPGDQIELQVNVAPARHNNL